MTDPSILEAHAGPLRSRVGGAFPGQRAVFRGHDLHRDLKDTSWLELYLFGITGRRLPAPQLRLLDTMWAYTSYPDARLWNNRVAALAGSVRSTGVMGIAAAIAVSEAGIYGRKVDIAIANFLTYTREQRASGTPLHQLVKEELRIHRGIAGFGRPIRRMDRDERIDPILKVAREQGLADGLHLRLAQEVEDILLAGRWRMRMNYAVVSAALALDMGLSPQEYYLFALPAFLAGMPPCYLDALDRPEGATLHFKCRQIHYTGPARRTWGES